MAHKFAEIAFTPQVKAVQEEMGSRKAYTNMEAGIFDYAHELSGDEATFIQSRDSFYMATTSETGWPYVQHRGGAPVPQHSRGIRCLISASVTGSGGQ